MRSVRFQTGITMLLLSVFSCVCTEVYGTTIVVMRAGRSVVLAADSLAIVNHEKNNICKIRKAGHIFFAIAGTESTEQFHAFALAEKAISQTGSLRAAAKAFMNMVSGPFEEALTRLRNERPSDYAEIRSKEQPLEAAFAAIENGVPKYVIVTFTITQNSNGRISVAAQYKPCPGSACPSSTTDINILGENAAATKKFARLARNDADAVSVSRKLIETEITSRPGTVGPPISILVIGPSGQTWIEQGECKKPDTKNKSAKNTTHRN